MEMTVDLFDSIINTSQDCVFWKDKNRRFLGVNQAFLDFYGFESEDVLLGKNDEEMGWHSDPEPFKQDELRVLAGKSTYKGILSRAYSMKFVHSLIAEKIPFTFTIIDLDNFKFINDTYGHTAGDKVLASVSKSLAEFTDGFALAGRFGGDELLLIDLKNITTNEKSAFFENLYGKSNTLRKEIFFENGAAFVTGTSGCASFPKDSDNFSDLFGLIDKMLYLGKNLGRNCYKVYEEEKHKYVEIRKIAKNGIFKNMYKLRTDIESETGFESVLISRIRKKDKVKGYLICAVNRSLRIWQENECAILYYLAELLSDDL